MRSRFSQTTGSASPGVHPDELWGTGSGPKKERRRGEKARARRRAKRAAKLRNQTLKSYLRTVK